MSREYVSNKQLLQCLTEYRAKKQADPATRIPNYVGLCLQLICTKLGSRYNFNGYSYNDDMVGDAIESCVMAVNNFDPAKSNNPFGYFSRVAWRAMIHRIDIEQTETYKKICNYENLHVVDIAHIDGESTTVGNEFTNEFVKKFETRLAERRAKRRPISASKKKNKRKTT